MRSNFTLLLQFLLISFTVCITMQAVVAQDVKILNLAVNDLVYIPSLDRIFVTVPSGQNNGNSICKIDPYFGTIEACYALGGEPNVLAASDDGRYLYVGFLTLPRIIRYDIEQEEIDLDFSLGKLENFPESFFADDIKILPGNPDVIAVVRRVGCCGAGGGGVAIYDKGVMRRDVTPLNTLINSITFGPDSTKLFGFTNASTELGFRVMSIDSNGVKVDQVFTGLFNAFGETIEYFRGKIYSSKGRVLNLANYNLEGVFNLPEAYPSAVEPAPDSNVVYAVTTTENELSNAVLKTFDAHNFNVIDEQILYGADPNVRKLITWGEKGRLVYFTRGFNARRQLVIIRNCSSLLTTPPVLTPNKAGGCYGETIRLTAAPGYPIYFWSNGINTPTINVEFGGQFSYAVPDSLGCLSSYSNPATVEFDAVPSSPYIEGSNYIEICQGSIVNLNAVIAYQGWSILWSNGATTPNIQVDSAGIYSVRAVTALGCASPPSNEVRINVLPQVAPTPPTIQITGDTVLCFGERVTLSVPEVYSGYIWSTGEQTSSIMASSAGNYTVQVENEVGCISKPSLPVHIAINFPPQPPNISANGNLLASSALQGNQWFLNGEAIPGATGQFYQATVSGFLFRTINYK